MPPCFYVRVIKKQSGFYHVINLNAAARSLLATKYQHLTSLARYNERLDVLRTAFPRSAMHRINLSPCELPSKSMERDIERMFLAVLRSPGDYKIFREICQEPNPPRFGHTGHQEPLQQDSSPVHGPDPAYHRGQTAPQPDPFRRQTVPPDGCSGCFPQPKNEFNGKSEGSCGSCNGLGPDCSDGSFLNEQSGSDSDTKPQLAVFAGSMDGARSALPRAVQVRPSSAGAHTAPPPLALMGPMGSGQGSSPEQVGRAEPESARVPNGVELTVVLRNAGPVRPHGVSGRVKVEVDNFD